MNNRLAIVTLAAMQATALAQTVIDIPQTGSNINYIGMSGDGISQTYTVPSGDNYFAKALFWSRQGPGEINSITFNIRDNSLSNPILYTQTFTNIDNGQVRPFVITPPTPIALTAGNKVFLQITGTGGNTASNVEVQSPSTYAGGEMWLGTSPWLSGDADLPGGAVFVSSASDPVPQFPSNLTTFGAFASGIVGVPSTASLFIQNTGAEAAGNYSVSATEVTFTGLTTGSVNAQDSAQIPFTFTPTTLGSSTAGTITLVNSSNPSDPDETVTVNVNAVNHARPSFSTSTDQRSTSFDFGIVNPNDPVTPLTLTLASLGTWSTNAYTELVSITGSGDTDVFDISAIADFIAQPQTWQRSIYIDDPRNFSIEMDSSIRSGPFSATYTIALNSATFGGGVDNGTLSFTLSGGVTPIPEPASLMLLAMGGLMLRGIRRS